ncbi:MAG: hypothetical protein HON27_09720 [Candidatus Marinimicrobia bacterium]|nr:hypothetical protein [Candidatus Neomarinimicrobiota bacterium]MBT4946432.1 hypothetical protein [Candidatus Neomarinimicrobiota bacterium]
MNVFNKTIHALLIVLIMVVTNAASAAITVDISALTNSSHPLNTPDNQIKQEIVMTWTAAQVTSATLSGYYYIFDTDDASSTTLAEVLSGTQLGSSAVSVTSVSLADSNSHYFHIVAFDSEGAFGSVQTYGPIVINTSPDVSTVTDSSGDNSGSNGTDQTLTISGSRFMDAVSVKVSTTSLQSVTRNSSQQITATLPSGFTAGTYDVEVTNTATGKSGTKSSAYTVTASNIAPTAVAAIVGLSAPYSYTKTDATSTVTISLTGADSTDTDASDTLTYTWSVDEVPTGTSNSSISSTTSINPTYQTQAAGKYVFGLMVSDGKSSSEKVQVVVVVSDSQSTDYPLVLEVGNFKITKPITGESISGVDFPEVSTSSNFIFKIDAASWEAQNTESAAFGFSLERKDRVETPDDEYRRALMVVRPLKIENGTVSLLPNTEVRGWGWKYQNQGEMAWRTVTNPSEVAQYISISGQTIIVDYHNLRTAAGLSATSDPNGFDWQYRLLWSKHLNQSSLQPLTSSVVSTDWLPLVLETSFTDPFDQGYGITGSVSVGGFQKGSITNNSAPIALAKAYIDGVNYSSYTYTGADTVTVTLNASDSFDYEFDDLSFQWSVLGKPSNASDISLSSSTGAQVNFQISTGGTYTLGLIANDGEFNSLQQQIDIVYDPSFPPIANAGLDENVIANGNALALNGGQSSDGDSSSGALSYLWSLTSSPSGSNATISSPTSQTASLAGYDKTGLYTIQLLVTDDGDLTGSDEIVITAGLGGVDRAASTIVLDSTDVIVESSITASITPRDENNNVLGSGFSVDLNSTIGEVSDVVYSGDGSYTATIVSSSSGEGIITATVNDILIDASETILFKSHAESLIQYIQANNKGIAIEKCGSINENINFIVSPSVLDNRSRSIAIDFKVDIARSKDAFWMLGDLPQDITGNVHMSGSPDGDGLTPRIILFSDTSDTFSDLVNFTLFISHENYCAGDFSIIMTSISAGNDGYELSGTVSEEIFSVDVLDSANIAIVSHVIGIGESFNVSLNINDASDTVGNNSFQLRSSNSTDVISASQILDSSGTAVFTVTAGEMGDRMLSIYTVLDGSDMLVGSKEISVRDASDAPNFNQNDFAYTASALVGSLYQSGQTPSVTNNDSYTSFFAVNLPSWASINENTGVITGTPTEADVGIYDDITLGVTDGRYTNESSPLSIQVFKLPLLTSSSTDTLILGEDSESQINISGGSSKFTYSSSDDNIVTIDGNGLITALEAGSATITATDQMFTSEVFTIEIAVIDHQAPTITADKPEGEYAGNVRVALKSNEQGGIYYTTDVSEPYTWIPYNDSSKILLSSTTRLRFYAEDVAGNQSDVGNMLYRVLQDSDFDGMPDLWEQQYNLEPFSTDESANDPDNDGFSNLVEYQQGTDPTTSNWKVNLSIDDQTLWPGASSELLIRLTPQYSTEIRSFNIGLITDSEELSVSDGYFGDSVDGWIIDTNSIEIPLSGKRQVNLTATQISGNPLSNETLIKLPINISPLSQVGHVFEVDWVEATTALTVDQYNVDITKGNGQISLGNGIIQYYAVYPGWNMVSFPMQLTRNSASEILDKSSNSNSIWKYQGGYWRSHIRSVPQFLNSLQNIESSIGYFIYNNGSESDEFTISGIPSASTIRLNRGWNAVGINQDVSDIDSFLDINNAASIWQYDPINRQWLSYFDGFDPVINSLKAPLTTGAGYFVNVE